MITSILTFGHVISDQLPVVLKYYYTVHSQLCKISAEWIEYDTFEVGVKGKSIHNSTGL